MEALNIIIAVLSCLLCVFLMAYQIYSNRRHGTIVSFSTRYLPWCLSHMALMSIWIYLAEHTAIYLLYINLLWGLFPILSLASSFLPQSRILIWGSVILAELYNILHFYLFKSDSVILTPMFYGFSAVILVMLYIKFFVISLWFYIRRIRNIVQKTTVWTMLSFSVDVVYALGIIGVSFLFFVNCIYSACEMEVLPLVCSFVLLFSVVALCYRISTDSLFFFMRSHENVILESLNDAPRDVTGGGASPEDLYKEIFERIIEHFERDMPFLSGSLVIDDLVKVVFANKLYISRAISRCAGRNFCQFVNYYRVKHSVDIFRKNPELKVAELSSLSGFNSVGSFTMAFKLYMNENPSDWMRQERNRIIKYRA